jgi:hypothetical protein
MEHANFIAFNTSLRSFDHLEKPLKRSFDIPRLPPETGAIIDASALLLSTFFASSIPSPSFGWLETLSNIYLFAINFEIVDAV